MAEGDYYGSKAAYLSFYFAYVCEAKLWHDDPKKDKNFKSLKETFSPEKYPGEVGPPRIIPNTLDEYFEEQKRIFINGIEKDVKSAPDYERITDKSIIGLVQVARDGNWSSADTIEAIYQEYHRLLALNDYFA